MIENSVKLMVGEVERHPAGVCGGDCIFYVVLSVPDILYPLPLGIDKTSFYLWVHD